MQFNVYKMKKQDLDKSLRLNSELYVLQLYMAD